jgi:hypothetical protein
MNKAKAAIIDFTDKYCANRRDKHQHHKGFPYRLMALCPLGPNPHRNAEAKRL